MAESQQISEPVGRWWAAFDDGTVWPVEVLATCSIFYTKVRATHPAAPQGALLLDPSQVYDSEFNRPKIRE